MSLRLRSLQIGIYLIFVIWLLEFRLRIESEYKKVRKALTDLVYASIVQPK